MAKRGLTPAQKELYEVLKEKGEVKCAEAYLPAKALVERGLAVWRSRKMGMGTLVLPKSN